MIGKIVKIKDDFGVSYIKIKKRIDENYVGYGFTIAHNDLGFMGNTVSEMLSFCELLDQWEIIDEVTFNRTFDQMVNDMRYKHLQEML